MREPVRPPKDRRAPALLGDQADRRRPRTLASEVETYFYDPTGGKAKAVRARYVESAEGWGAHTQPHNGEGDVYA